MKTSRPPRGGRGLKLTGATSPYKLNKSPPSRGAWIEMGIASLSSHVVAVAPLAGGVD